ncbi:MAG: hypothetical protein M0P19_15130 [Nevskia sp.]|jgi:hypothetical protein|nr:hypothetical protein [Nevskia sp.]MCK9385816.1 hypothetical protein [Nevskia sp.]
MKKLLLIAFLAPLSLLQPAAAADPEVAVEAAQGALPCPRPDLAVNLRKKEEADELNKKVVIYRDCVQAYVNTQKKNADQHAAAANGAVSEFNAFSTELNEKYGKTNQE